MNQESPEIKSWYYEDKGQRIGAITQAEIVQLIDQRVLTNDSLVWKNGYPEWTKTESFGGKTGEELKAEGK